MVVVYHLGGMTFLACQVWGFIYEVNAWWGSFVGVIYKET